MAGYIGTVPVPQATETRDVYVATANQTTFTTGGYTPNFVSVYLNGVHLARADYTDTNGSDVVLAAGAAADDTVEIISFNTFEVASPTFTGDVTASGGTFLPTGDTAAGDDAAVGYAAADGLVLTGQGSTSDVTIKNDADATVMSIATGTTGATFAGDVIVPDGDLILGSTAVTATAAEINLIDGGTARGTTAIVDADGVLVNDAGTMRMTTMATLATYMGTKISGGATLIYENEADGNSISAIDHTSSAGSDLCGFDIFLTGLRPNSNSKLVVEPLDASGNQIGVEAARLGYHYSSLYNAGETYGHSGINGRDAIAHFRNNVGAAHGNSNDYSGATGTIRISWSRAEDRRKWQMFCSIGYAGSDGRNYNVVDQLLCYSTSRTVESLTADLGGFRLRNSDGSTFQAGSVRVNDLVAE